VGSKQRVSAFAAALLLGAKLDEVINAAKESAIPAWRRTERRIAAANARHSKSALQRRQRIGAHRVKLFAQAETDRARKHKEWLS
jgi:hypothetical protein